jgi:hypothetical protein
MDYHSDARRRLDAGSILLVGGVWDGQHVRDGKVIDEWEDHNLVVNEGLNHAPRHHVPRLDPDHHVVHRRVRGQLHTGGDGHRGDDHRGVDRVHGLRRDDAPGVRRGGGGGQSITNSANKATFTFNATKTIYGAFLVASAKSATTGTSASAKSATTGTLFSAAAFSTPSRSSTTISCC